MKLDWHHGIGGWSAPSIVTSNAEDEDLLYKIEITEDGYFDLSLSDDMLYGHDFPSFPTLFLAKKWCEDNEVRLTAMV